jgi:hypothetical protein
LIVGRVVEADYCRCKAQGCALSNLP